MSRIENTARNSVWQIAATLTSTLAGVVGRILFMKILGEQYLGISGLFASIIGVLSFADLGLGSAFTFCFYKPIAQNDIPHIQVLLSTFKKVIFFIAAFIALAGLVVIPFLRTFVKGAENIDDLHLVVYYLISLFGTVFSYWLMYKTCYITARQEAYRLTPFTMVGTLTAVMMQICALLLTQNYTVWALCAVAVTVCQQIGMNIYIIKKYPETSFDCAASLAAEDKKSILDNIKGLLMHKFGGILVTQTDNIIVSSFISVSVTGLLSNYVLLRTMILNIISTIQNSLVASMGDLMVRENKEVQLNVFCTYMMVNYWMLGFAMCGLGVLSTPFIALIFGATKILDDWTILFSCMGFYFAYQTYALNLLPTAGGKFILGAWAAALEGVSNLIISVAAVKFIGLPGVFLGTLASQIINYAIRPFPIFKGMYGEKPWSYFKQTLAHFLSAMAPYILLLYLRGIIFSSGYTVWGFLLLGVLTVAVFIASVILFWHKNKYFKEACNLFKKIVADRVVKK